MVDIQNRINWRAIDFDWNRARTFLLVAKAGSLSAAAKQTGQHQPTLSRQIAALEAELAVTLFERDGRGIQLTESGHQLVQFVEAMADAAAQFSLGASGQEMSLQGKVTISASELDATYRLPDVIGLIRQQAPQIEIEVVVTNQLSSLQQREADIALRNMRPTEHDLIARKLAREPIGLFGSKQYVTAQEKTQFKEVSIVSFGNTEQMINVLKPYGMPLTKENFPVTAPFQLLQVALAKQGQCLIFLPFDIAEKEELEQVKPDLPAVMELDAWLVCHRELRTNPRVRFAYQALADQLKF